MPGGTTCEGKAALVLRGTGSVVDGLVFRNIRVPDGNGAGIRTEWGDLTVTDSIFLANASGQRLVSLNNRLGPGIRPYEAR